MYTNNVVENLLRNYYTLQDHPDSTFSFYKIDLELGLKKLKQTSPVLYSTIVGVFIDAAPIQEQAKVDKVTTRQTNRRLHDATHLLTMIMNGEVL